MPHTKLIFLVAISSCWLTSELAMAQAAPSGKSGPQVVSTRNMSFAIPYAVETTGENVVEVQLHVSADNGRTWNLHARQRPQDGQFIFRAPREGEYNFTSKTVNAQGQLHPPGPCEAEMRIIVDLTAPRLAFTANVGSSGEVKSNWEIQDELLDPATFKLEFQAGPGAAWEPVAIERPTDATETRSLKGQVAWWPKTSAKYINVKAEVRDRAGNPAVVQRRLFLPATANHRPPTNGQNVVAGLAKPNGPTDPFRRLQFDQQHETQTAPVTPTTPATPSPSTNNSNENVIDQAALARNLFASGNTQQKSLASKTNPTLEDSLIPPALAKPTSKPIVGELPGGERPRMTNTKRFALDYSIDSVGPGGVAEVEIWCSRDGSQSWSKWGSDQDLQSPYVVEVKEEGIYGFRIVVISRNGSASPAPQPGETADLWVGVDVTPPSAQIASVSYGEGDHAGQLEIRWEATDFRFPQRPISLAYSESVSGPWKEFATGVPNGGQFFWTPDARVPKKIFLQLNVRDEAGNAAQHQIQAPISLDGLTPGAKIKNITPAEIPDRGAFKMPWRR